MTRLPARHQHHTSQARYEFGAAYGSVHTVPQEPFSVRDNALSLAFTALWLIPLICVTIGFLTT